MSLLASIQVILSLVSAVQILGGDDKPGGGKDMCVKNMVASQTGDFPVINDIMFVSGGLQLGTQPKYWRSFEKRHNGC